MKWQASDVMATAMQVTGRIARLATTLEIHALCGKSVHDEATAPRYWNSCDAPIAKALVVSVRPLAKALVVSPLLSAP
eukprot:394156-Amphidinium_carterae.1